MTHGRPCSARTVKVQQAGTPKSLPAAPPAPPAMQGAGRPLPEPNQALVVALPAGQGLGVAAQDDTRGTMPELPSSAIGSPVFEPVKMLCSCTCEVGWYVCSPQDRTSQQAGHITAVRATLQNIPQA